MSHLPFTLLAYLFNAASVTVDKFLLVKKIPNPLLYIFYISAFSLIILLALPFTKTPSFFVFTLASLSTILWTSGAYFMFKALQVGLISRVVPVIGTLIPTLLLTNALITRTISPQEIIAVILLISGLIFLTLMDWKGQIKKSEIIFIILSASFFALSYIILRQAYLQMNFLTVFVWSRFILLPIGITILLLPQLRQAVFSQNSSQPSFKLLSKTGALFLAGQAAGGSSELLITFSISLANPTLVNSLQGTQYAFLFLFSIILARRFPKIYKEKLLFINTLTKILGIVFIAGGLFLLAQ